MTFHHSEGNALTVKWWETFHPKVHIPTKALSSTGVVVFDDKQPVAITHVYSTTTSKLGWIGFTVRNPEAPAFRAGRALNLLFSEAEKLLKGMGCEIVFTGFDSPALQRLVVKRGYLKGSTTTEYFRGL